MNNTTENETAIAMAKAIIIGTWTGCAQETIDDAIRNLKCVEFFEPDFMFKKFKVITTFYDIDAEADGNYTFNITVDIISD